MAEQKWYEKSGPEGDIIISTRVRFARNLLRYPFPCRLTLKQREEIIAKVRQAAESGPLTGYFHFLDISTLSDTERVSLVERHLISPDLIAEPSGRGVLITEDESISIMINEEDHLRIQVMSEGFQFENALQTADRIDSFLGEQLGFAFDERLGYLTQCPTNLGTGMRASVMLHLPALQESGAIARIANNISKLGIAIRGIYGEASKPKGALYQLSNQVTLGLSEQAAIDNLKSITDQLLHSERAARKKMSDQLEVQDFVSRSLGILTTAKLLNNDEFMKLISNVRLGVSAGLISGLSPEALNALTIRVQPATIQLIAGKALEPAQRDLLRAQMVQEVLP